MRKISKSRAKQMRTYGKLRIEFLKENTVCALCGKPAIEVHHKAGRSGIALIDLNNFLSVCRPCHQVVEANPTWAKKMGYSKSRLEFV